MYNHAPSDYNCPFCQIIAQVETDPEAYGRHAIVYHNEQVTVLVPNRFFKNNAGQVIIIPNRHYENIYDLPDEFGGAIHKVAKKLALAMKKAYQCEGISTRQHNEPAGNQDVWHYHLHVFPRHAGDNLYFSFPQPSSLLERITYAEKLRKALA
jgi:histidine triad (HIT) family protein